MSQSDDTSKDQPVDELAQIEKDLADSFEQFRLAEGAYMSGTPASSMIAAHQFIVRLQAYFKDECQAECNRAKKEGYYPNRQGSWVFIGDKARLDNYI